MGQSPRPNPGLPGDPGSPQPLLGARPHHTLPSCPTANAGGSSRLVPSQQRPPHAHLDPRKALPGAFAFWERRERQPPGAHCRRQREGAGAQGGVCPGRQSEGTQGQRGPGPPLPEALQVPWGTVPGPGGPGQGPPGVTSAKWWSRGQMGLPLSSLRVLLPSLGEHLASEELGPRGVGMCHGAGLCPHSWVLRPGPLPRSGKGAAWGGGNRLPAAPGGMRSPSPAPPHPAVPFPNCLEMPVTCSTASERVSQRDANPGQRLGDVRGHGAASPHPPGSPCGRAGARGPRADPHRPSRASSQQCVFESWLCRAAELCLQCRFGPTVLTVLVRVVSLPDPAALRKLLPTTGVRNHGL